MRRYLFLLALLLPPSPGSAQTIGVVTLAEGGVGLIRDSGYFSLEEGVEVDDGDIIETTSGSSTQLEMRDGSLFELGPESRFYLSDYRLREDDSVAAATLSLVRGWLRFATGRIRAGDDYQINTTTATIGIRGTGGTVEADDVSSSLLLDDGLVEFFELDDAGAIGTSRLVRAGEFAGRERGKSISHLASGPVRFMARIPKRLKAERRRLKAKLERSGVAPRKLREIDYEDLRPFLEANPRASGKLAERFKSKLEDRKFRERRRDEPPGTGKMKAGKAGKVGSTAPPPADQRAEPKKKKRTP